MSFDNSPNPYASPDRLNQGPYDQASHEQIKGKLMGPGVSLIVVGVIGLLGMGGYFLLTVIAMNMPGNPAAIGPPPGASEAEKTGYYVGFYGAMVCMVISALAQIVVIMGGLSLIKMKGRGLAMAACVISLVPFTSACCLLGIPFGIWGLVTLSDSAVKQALQ